MRSQLGRKRRRLHSNRCFAGRSDTDPHMKKQAEMAAPEAEASLRHSHSNQRSMYTSLVYLDNTLDKKTSILYIVNEHGELRQQG